MFMEEVFTSLNLSPVQSAYKRQMTSTLSELCGNDLWIHLWMIHCIVPQHESCTWRTTDHPCGVTRVDEITGLFAIGFLGEVPWRPIVFGSAYVEGIRAPDIDISADIVRRMTMAPRPYTSMKVDWQLLQQSSQAEA